MDNYLDVALEIARESGALLAQLAGQPHEISYKRKSDIVTDADRRSEAMILERLRRHFPDHAIVAEESGSKETGSDYCWYVDPLDGTTNFAHGFPVYCVTLALAYRDEVIAGVVYDPNREEMFAAERGAGATLNGKPIRVSRTGDLAESLLGTGFPPFASNHDLNTQLFFRLTQISHGIRRAGAAALDLCSVAAGRFEGFWELKLNPWDKAAGSLLVTEAGGRVGDLSGGPFSLHRDEICATNGLIHESLIEVFSEILEEHGKVKCGQG
ncbi:MAG TPA: inositol monophosphatase family protein [Terriglobia bacterium]|nr:inositol monophosphatase family protein [Terriglobia bacterium]